MASAARGTENFVRESLSAALETVECEYDSMGRPVVRGSSESQQQMDEMHTALQAALAERDRLAAALAAAQAGPAERGGAPALAPPLLLLSSCCHRLAMRQWPASDGWAPATVVVSLPKA